MHGGGFIYVLNAFVLKDRFGENLHANAKVYDRPTRAYGTSCASIRKTFLFGGLTVITH